MKKQLYSLFLFTLILIGGATAQTTYNSSGTYTTGPTETCLRVQVWGAGILLIY